MQSRLTPMYDVPFGNTPAIKKSDCAMLPPRRIKILKARFGTGCNKCASIFTMKDINFFYSKNSYLYKNSHISSLTWRNTKADVSGVLYAGCKSDRAPIDVNRPIQLVFAF